MKRCLLVLIAVVFVNAAPAQTFPMPDYFRQFFVKPRPQGKLASPLSLETYITDGKLRLSLDDAVRLTLRNNTDVQVNLINTGIAEYAVMKSHAPFDPVFLTSYNPVRSTSPTTSTLQGANTLSSLNQVFSSSYTQLFATGTTYQVSLNASKNASNSTFSTFNPAISSSLNISLSQPLLRNRGWFITHAPIVIAQRNLKISRANFDAFVNSAMLNAINQYWDVVQARENLKVLRDSQALAEASYQQNKRALELGALPPLDIFRSESQVAQRKLQVIQAEYQLKQLEDQFRQTIGADLDPRLAALDLDLYESTASMSNAAAPAADEVVKAALQARPELEALTNQSAIDDANLRVAANGLKPDLSFSTFYNTAGRGGNSIDTSTGVPIVTSRGGLGDAFDQLGSLDFPSYGFNVQLRLPLRNRSAEADWGSALTNQRRTMLQRRQREQDITLQARNAVHQLEQAKLSVAAGQIALDLAQKNLQAEQRKYELGAQTIFFVLDAQTQLSSAQQSLVQAQISYQRALASLDRVTGELLNHYQVQIREVAR